MYVIVIVVCRLVFQLHSEAAVSRSQYAPSSDNRTRNDHSEVHDFLSLFVSLYQSCVTFPTLCCICSVVRTWFRARILVKYKLVLVYFVERSR